MDYQSPPQSSYPPPGSFPQPPHRPGLRQRFGSLPLLGKIGIGCGAALALVLVCLCALIALGAVVGGNSTGNATPTPGLVLGQTPTATQVPTQAPTMTPSPVQSPSPTSMPKPTATPTPAGPHPVNEAAMGGTEAAFTAKYGPPTLSASEARQYQFTLNGVQGVISVTLTSDDTKDGKAHAVSMNVGPASGSWSQITADAVCKNFLPSDAKFHQNKKVSGYGTEHVYVSADLAATFPSGDFSDNSTLKPVTPGTFSIESGPGWPLDKGCIIILGD